MSYRLAICDDDPQQRDSIRDMVQAWGLARGETLQISCFPSAEAFWFEYVGQKAYDILLLDIEMAQMDGVTLARKVRAGNKEVQIIFITGYMEYIADGYEVEALHYLIKPVSEPRLHQVLERAAERLKRNERALYLELGDESVRVPLYEIRYLEVQRNYVTIHAQADYTVKTPLSELEKALGEAFVRTGRSHIVHLKYVRRITRTDVFLLDGRAVPLSRGLYEAINRAMIERL